MRRIIIWSLTLVMLVSGVTAWAIWGDEVTDDFALKDMREDIAAMQLVADPAPKKSPVETLPNPRIVTVTRDSHTFMVVAMNVLANGCSVELQRSRTETRYHLEGGSRRKIEVYTPVLVWYNYAPIDLMGYESQADAYGPGDLAKFLDRAVRSGADLPCFVK